MENEIQTTSYAETNYVVQCDKCEDEARFIAWGEDGRITRCKSHAPYNDEIWD